ncbi:MAG: SDR family oxidoreductase [Pseudomonadota bacterium]
MQEPVLILGARSDIARACAHVFAKKGHSIQLAARNAVELGEDAADLRLRYGVEVTCHEFDALDIHGHLSFLDSLQTLPVIAICAVGTMGAQGLSEIDATAALRDIRSNFEGPAMTMSTLANLFEARGSGTLVGISSVAGLRGRATNYTYGAAKAGFTAFLSGMRNRLAKKGVHVVTVLPGFVDTAMTADLDLPGPLTAQPSEVAQAIATAVVKKRNVIYVGWIWRWIMIIICNIPEGIFKKLSI